MDGTQGDSVVPWNVGSFDLLDDGRVPYPILEAKAKSGIAQELNRQEHLLIRPCVGDLVIAQKRVNRKHFDESGLDLARLHRAYERTELSPQVFVLHPHAVRNTVKAEMSVIRNVSGGIAHSMEHIVRFGLIAWIHPVLPFTVVSVRQIQVISEHLARPPALRSAL